MPSHAMQETLLRKTLALPIFASDALSSVAYATEAALIVLIGTSLASAYLVVPVSAAVSLLLAIVVLSYRQTVRAYSTSGGSYVVSRENLGTIPSLVAGGRASHRLCADGRRVGRRRCARDRLRGALARST